MTNPPTSLKHFFESAFQMQEEDFQRAKNEKILELQMEALRPNMICRLCGNDIVFEEVKGIFPSPTIEIFPCGCDNAD